MVSQVIYFRLQTSGISILAAEIIYSNESKPCNFFLSVERSYNLPYISISLIKIRLLIPKSWWFHWNNKMRNLSYKICYIFSLFSSCSIAAPSHTNDGWAQESCPLISRYNNETGVGIFAGRNFNAGDIFETSLGIPAYLPHIRHTALGKPS